MKVFKFYPKNRTKFHFGSSHGRLEEIFSSDKLFSALFNCALLVCGLNNAENVLVLLKIAVFLPFFPGYKH